MSDKYEIVITGTPLTEAQKMALGVAINDYLMFVDTKDSLGNDETGRAIAKGYSDRLKEIVVLCVPAAAKYSGTPIYPDIR